MGDQIDEAIAATEPIAKAPPAEPLTITVTIASTGRKVALTFPKDLTDSELLEFIGWEGTNLRVALANERAKGPASGLVIARQVPPRNTS